MRAKTAIIGPPTQKNVNVTFYLPEATSGGQAMNRQERSRQKKRKARQERLRQEKHPRQSPRPENKTTASTALARDDRDPSAGPAVPARAADPPAEPLDDFFKGEPARNWLDALLAGNDLDAIVRTLDAASYVPGDLVLKASVCCEMLVAAEVVAAARGRPSRHLPSRVVAWLRKQDALFSPGVAMLAAAAVQRVGQFSELRQLWDTARLGQEWLRGVEELHGRLQL
jgi:Domain of unknown function (DUF4259)